MDTKKFCKIFIIVGMVLGCFAILPIVFGFMALDKLDTAKKKEELTTMAILTLLFCSTIGGILMLCMEDKDLAGANIIDLDLGVHKTTNPHVEEELVEIYDDDLVEIIEPVNTTDKLRNLKSLYDDGIITEEEFNEKKKTYLSEL